MTEPGPDADRQAAQSTHSCPMCGEPLPVDSRPAVGSTQILKSLSQSRPAVLFLSVVCGVLALLSATGFLYHWGYELSSGLLFRRTEGAWVYLSGHVLRAAGCGVLARMLWLYAQSIQTFQRGETESQELFTAQNRCWLVLAGFVLVMIVYAVFNVAYMWSLATRTGQFQPG